MFNFGKKNPQSTTPKLASTQNHLDISEIREGIVILKNGGMRVVLLVNSINFALKSEQEQNSLIVQYQSFLNSLSFPIQITVRSKKLDLTNYVSTLKGRLESEENELISLQITEYIDFIERLINIANIMDKKFFITIPLDTVKTQMSNISKVAERRPSTRLTVDQFKACKSELNERASVIISGLAGMGLKAALLNTQQLIELYYNIYNPEEGAQEKLTNVEAIQSQIIQSEDEAPKPTTPTGQL